MDNELLEEFQNFKCLALNDFYDFNNVEHLIYFKRILDLILEMKDETKLTLEDDIYKLRSYCIKNQFYSVAAYCKDVEKYLTKVRVLLENKRKNYGTAVFGS